MSEEHPNPQSSANRNHEATGERLAVLWVDDDETLLRYVTLLSQRFGFDVAFELSGEGALSRASRQQFDVIVLDQRLNGLSGLDVLRRLRSQGSETPVVFFTAVRDFGTAIQAGQLGAVAYQTKPARNSRTLAEAVRAAARLRPPSRGGRVTSDTAIQEFGRLSAAVGDVAWSHSTDLTPWLLRLTSASTDMSLNLVQFTGAARLVQIAFTLATTDADTTWNVEATRAMLGFDAAGCRRDVGTTLRHLQADPMHAHEEALANRVNLSSSRFGQVLHAHTGLWFRDLRRAALIRPTLAMLASTDEPVRQIAFRRGYAHSNVTQFFHDFRAVIGLSPKAFRESVTTSPRAAWGDAPQH